MISFKSRRMLYPIRLWPQSTTEGSILVGLYSMLLVEKKSNILSGLFIKRYSVRALGMV